MRFDLVIPARNEAANIQDALRRLITALRSLTEVEWGLAVVINGTTDETIQRINEYRISNIEYRERVTAIECPGEGKGAAIRFAAERSASPDEQVRQSDGPNGPSGRADKVGLLFGFIDADLSADPDMIAPMVRAILADEADVVIGSRLLQTRTTNRGWLRTLSSKLFNLAVHLSLGLKVKDAQCGLKIMNSKGRKLLMDCRENGWFLDIEFLAKAVQDGLRIREVPVPWIEFRYAGRKSQIRYFRDGLELIMALRRIRSRLKRYA
jgi:glycosyltransferase involved in cell wall biosynthesis